MTEQRGSQHPAQPDDFEPNPEAVRRISAHLWGEDFRNLKAAVESFPNGYTVVPKEAAASAPTPARCDRIVNNGMGEPTECGRTLPCEVHDAPTPAEPLDVGRMREAHRIAYRDGTDVVVEYNRLAAARPDTPASAEQPGLREALERAAANLIGYGGWSVYQVSDPCTNPTGPNEVSAEDLVDELMARLAASPSPDPEGKW